MSSKLHVLDASQFQTWGDTAEAFLAQLQGPTLIRVPGEDRARTRAASGLIHGNEPSGLRAIHRWLSEENTPAVDTLLLISAVKAARLPPGLANRMVPGTRDLNRCFFRPYHDAQGQLAQAILEQLRSAQPDALVDLHNNTGHNPSYAVAAQLTPVMAQIASIFGTRYILSDLSLGSLTEGTDQDFPSVTIECGRAQDPKADEVAYAGLREFLALDRIKRDPTCRLEVFKHPIRVSLRPECSVAFAKKPLAHVSVTIDDEVDRHNFQTLEAGQTVGWLRDPTHWPIEARGASGADCARQLFRISDNRLELLLPLTPIMMTTNPVIARSDCLFYVVEPVPA